MNRNNNCLQPREIELPSGNLSIFSPILFYILFSYPSVASGQEIVFHKCDFTEFRGRDEAHAGLFPISGEPVVGLSQDISATLFGAIASADFRFVSPSGSLIENIILQLPPDAHPRETEYLGQAVPPEEPFQLAVSGFDANGNAFDLTCGKIFNSQPVTIKIRRDPFEIKPGTTTYFPEVTNHGEADTFSIAVSNADGFVSRVSPASLTLASGESQTIEMDISVPTGTADGKKVSIRAVVTSTTFSGISNFAEMKVGVIIPAEITPPPDVIKEATAPLTPVDLGTPVTTDNDGIDVVFSNAPESFRVGVFSVKWLAIDTDGNESTAFQTVTITDTTGPSITTPLDITLQGTGQLTAVDIGQATAVDLVSGVSINNDSPEEGFPIG